MRVLLIDNDVIQLKMVTAWLEQLSFRVEAVDNVIDGLRIVGTTDLVMCLVDWRMTPFRPSICLSRPLLPNFASPSSC